MKLTPMLTNNNQVASVAAPKKARTSAQVNTPQNNTNNAPLPSESVQITNAPVKTESTVETPVINEVPTAPAGPTVGDSIDAGNGQRVTLASNGLLLMEDPGLQATGNVGTVTPGQLNFDKGAEVISSAQKFILPVPKFEGEPLVYPKGAQKDGKDVGGQPITDWQGKPIGDKGVVFFNHQDKSWQAVKADGEGVIIMNQVTEEQGKKIQEKVGGDPNKLSLEQFKDVLSYAHSQVGADDMYNSDRGFIKSKMNANETTDTGIPQYGLYRRDDRDVCHAVFVEGSGEFQGPAATPQKFDDGAVIIRQPGKEPSYRLIQPEIFAETYKNKNGSSIDLDRLPRQNPNA